MNTLSLRQDAATKNRLTFLIIDDHPIVIDGMTMAFQTIDPHADILTVPSVERALDSFGKDEQFALIMLGLTLQDELDFTLLSALKTAMVDIPIVLYSADERVDTIYRALNAGAMGIISKRSQTAVLVGALRLVLAGGIYIPPQILTAMQISHPPSFSPTSPSFLAQEHARNQVHSQA
ncbi:MAG: response regulator [Glaciimonas sp.]|nr:response regulator [Glaciimonas sp.]